MGRFKRFKKEETGSIMVEATIYFPIIIICVMALLCISLVRVQEAYVEYQLNELADNLASTYGREECASEYSRYSAMNISDSLFAVPMRSEKQISVRGNSRLDVRYGYLIHVPNFVSKLLIGNDYIGVYTSERSYAAVPTEMIRNIDLICNFDEFQMSHRISYLQFAYNAKMMNEIY